MNSTTHPHLFTFMIFQQLNKGGQSSFSPETGNPQRSSRKIVGTFLQKRKLVSHNTNIKTYSRPIWIKPLDKRYFQVKLKKAVSYSFGEKRIFLVCLIKHLFNQSMLSNIFRHPGASCLPIHSGATVPPYLKLTVRSLQIVDPQVQGARHFPGRGCRDSVSPVVQSSMFLMHILNRDIFLVFFWFFLFL